MRHVAMRRTGRPLRPAIRAIAARVPNQETGRP